MISKRIYKNIGFNLLRKYSSKPKIIATLDEKVENNIQNEEFKPRKHPGIIQLKNCTVPDNLVKAIECVISDFPVKNLIKDSAELIRHLKGRKPPIEKHDVHTLAENIQEKILKKTNNIQITNEEDEKKLKQYVQEKVNTKLKMKVYNWKPLMYNVHNSLVYLLGRVAPEYAVLMKVFTEIQARDPNFAPRSLFDFGSGVGTVTWAANNFWKNHFFEYFNVDASGEMNELAQILHQGGHGNQPPMLKGTFYRQFLPATNTPYDLVVSAYSLLELPSLKSRLDTLLKLWNKTQNYLVIIEHGTTGGFKVLNEAREFILRITSKNNNGHIFSPCPHDSECPQGLVDNSPCNFFVRYHSLPIGATSKLCSETFCYVVFKRGPRDLSEPQWPRVVKPTLVRSRHTICRFCTAKGKLEEVIFTPSKHGKITYHCARSTKWGDRVPVTLKDNDVNVETT